MLFGVRSLICGNHDGGAVLRRIKISRFLLKEVFHSLSMRLRVLSSQGVNLSRDPVTVRSCSDGSDRVWLSDVSENRTVGAMMVEMNFAVLNGVKSHSVEPASEVCRLI